MRSGLALLFLCLSGIFAAATAERRVALVIGNAAYRHAPTLSNPVNDANAMADVLSRIGFEVISGRDMSKLDLETKIREFALKLSDADAAVFFYAGHAVQVAGVNYLVPIEAQLSSPISLDFETIRFDAVQRLMEQTTRTSVLFLDACRDNPLTRNLARSLGTRSTSIKQGLAAMESGAGTLISFSTQPGNVALDGGGRNSPYSAALVDRIAESKGEDIASMLIDVRNAVMDATKNQQVPWEHSALRARFFFKRPTVDAPASAPAPVPQSRPSEQLELSFWETVRDSDDARDVQAYLDRFPDGTFAALARLKLARLSDRPDPVPPSKGASSPSAPSATPPPLDTMEPQTAAAAAPPPSPRPEADETEIVRDLQAALKRVGCDPGPVDGKWGRRARSALQAFAEATRLDLDADAPNQSAFEEVTKRKERVCALTCDDDERVLAGRCVAKARERTEPNRSQRAERPPRRSSGSGSGSKKIEGTCWNDAPGRHGSAFVPCTHAGQRRAY